MRYLKWVMARLAGPRAPQAVIAIALLLALPSLLSPLFIDEYVQAARWRAALEHADGRSIWSFFQECFVFASGKAADYQREMEQVHGAWWAAPDAKTAFWRPLAAATHAIDLSLWPRSAVLMHVHSLLWFAALLYALHVLYRRFLMPRVATLALALYAWDDARGWVLSWIAKRHALLACLFGICAIIAYDKWRRDGWRGGAFLSPLLLAVGLLSSEMALATTGFLFAYALCLDQGSVARRMARLVPHLLVVVVWQAVYLASGYGAEASVNYLHPLREPVAYARRLVEAAPVLSLAQLTPLDAVFWGAYPPAVKIAVYLLALALVIALARIAWPRLKHEPQVRFWLIGAGLSILPICATGPSDSNLGFVGIGVAAALAMVFVSLVDDSPALRWPRFVIGAVAVFNLGVGPLLLPAKCLAMLGMGYGLPLADASIPRDPSVAQKTLVVVWTMSEGGTYASWCRRYAEGIPRPGRTRLLAESFADVSVTRLDEVTLRLHIDGGFLDSKMHRLLRGPSRPFHQGDVVELSNMTATVNEITGDGRPRTVTFRFAAPLESPEWLWMRGEGFRFVDWTPPRVGETVVVPAVTF